MWLAGKQMSSKFKPPDMKSLDEQKNIKDFVPFLKLLLQVKTVSWIERAKKDITLKVISPIFSSFNFKSHT